MNERLLHALEGTPLIFRLVFFFFGVSQWGKRHIFLNAILRVVTLGAMIFGGFTLMINWISVPAIRTMPFVSLLLTFGGAVMFVFGIVIWADLMEPPNA